MKTVTLTVGVFDMLHEGHADLLERMRGMGTPYVIVHDDLSTYRNKRRFPVQCVEQRMVNLDRLEVKNLFVTEDADPTETLREVVGLIRKEHGDDVKMAFVRGDDWPNPPGKPYLDAEGIEMILKPYFDGMSSTRRREEKI